MRLELGEEVAAFRAHGPGPGPAPRGERPRRGRVAAVVTASGRELPADLVVVGIGPYRELPWFWSHQGPTRVQIGGLVAVESVNSPADHLAARRLLGAGRSLSPEDAADPSFDLKAYSRAVPAPA